MCPDNARVILGDDDNDYMEAVKFSLCLEGHSIVCEVSAVDSQAVQRVKKVVEEGAEVAVFDGSLIDRGGVMGRQMVDLCKGSGVFVIGNAIQRDLPWADINVRKEHGNLLDAIRSASRRGGR